MSTVLQLTSPVPYFGAKNKLCPWIFRQLAKTLDLPSFKGLTLIDAFSGGGAVSLYAKSKGFHLISNDQSDRSQLVLTGIIRNQYKRLPGALALQMALNEMGDEGFVTRQFAGSVFSMRHAQALDTALAFIEGVTDSNYQALLRLVLWRHIVRFVSFGTSVGTSNRPYAEALDGIRPYASLNPKRFQDGSLERLLTPVWQQLENDVNEINRCIFPAYGTVSVYQQDVFELLPKVSGDIVYLDPPYPGTLGYSKANEVLDAVLFGRLPAQVPESPFTHSPAALAQLLDGCRHIPVWAISYNDKVLSLEELKTLVQQVDPSRQVEGFAKAYAHMPHVAKRQNHELLIIATERSI